MKNEKEKQEAPAKKLFLIRGEDVEKFEGSEGDEKQIAKIHLKHGGRVVQIDDNPAGRGVLSTNIRRVVGEKATSRLISGDVKNDKQHKDE